MVKSCRSISSLNYYAVLPFWEGVAERVHNSPNARGLIDMAISRSEVAIRHQCIKDDRVMDDCNVSLCCLLRKTHVCLYMRLPVILSVQSCVETINQSATRAMRGSEVFPRLEHKKFLFKQEFLIMSGMLDCEPLQSADTKHLNILRQIFYTQNNLCTDDISNRKQMIESWKAAYPPLAEGDTIYV